MRQILPTLSTSANMCSDASKSGFGATYGRSWIQSTWPSNWVAHDITVLELYPIFLLISLHALKIQNSHIIFHCDNMAVVEILNKQSS